MRFKSMNIENRSSKYSDTQKESLSVITESMNKVGEVFDNFIEFEQFIIKDIKKELNDYFNVRENRSVIIKENGNDYYINNVFLPVVEALEKRLQLAVENWNSTSDINIESLNIFAESMKSIYQALKNFPNLETAKAIKELCDSFANFMVYRAVNAEDRAKKMESLYYLKESLDEVEEVKPEKKRFTIDDL